MLVEHISNSCNQFVSRYSVFIFKITHITTWNILKRYFAKTLLKLPWKKAIPQVCVDSIADSPLKLLEAYKWNSGHINNTFQILYRTSSTNTWPCLPIYSCLVLNPTATSVPSMSLSSIYSADYHCTHLPSAAFPFRETIHATIGISTLCLGHTWFNITLSNQLIFSYWVSFGNHVALVNWSVM